MLSEKRKKQRAFFEASWERELNSIIDDYNHYLGGELGEPLNGDDIEDLCDLLKAKIQLWQGDITQKRYNGGRDV